MFNDLRVFVRQSSHSPPVPYSILFYEEVLCCSYIFTLQFKTLVNCFRELETEEKVNFFQGPLNFESTPLKKAVAFVRCKNVTYDMRNGLA